MTPAGKDQQAEAAGSGITDLAGRARQAVAWTTGFTLFRDILQFGVMLVLVRILPPEVYGQFGFVTALLGFLTLYSFREFLGHTLQVREDDRVHYQDHFSAGAVVQVSIFVLANVLALVLRWIPDYAAVSPALHVMSVLFLLDLPGELRTKMLQRALDWRRLRLLHGAALLVGSALSIGMALDGWGLYALLVPTLIVPLPFICDLFVGLRWRPTWAWDWGRFRPAWRFGTSRILALSFVSAAVLLESSWLAGALGFAVLGVFGRAVRLAELLCGRLAGLLATSVYPVLTRIQPRTDQYRRASAMYLRSIAWVVLPVGGAAMLMAGPLVRTLYGGQWLEVIPVLPWAVAVGALTAMVQTGYTLLLAHQRQDRCLLADVWRLIGTTAALVGLLGFGLEAYLAGLAAVHVVALAMVLAWLRADDAVTNRGLSQALLPPVVGVLVGVAAALIVGPLGGEREPWRMVVQASLFAGSYALVLRFGFRKQLRELVAQLPEQRRISRWLGLQEAT